MARGEIAVHGVRDAREGDDGERDDDARDAATGRKRGRGAGVREEGAGGEIGGTTRAGARGGGGDGATGGGGDV